MPPTFVPGPNPYGVAAGPARRARAADDPYRRRGGRRPAGDAVPQPPALPRAHASGGRRGAGPRSGRGVDRGLSAGDRRDGPDARRARRSHRGVRGLLAFYGSTPAYRPVLDVEGWGDLQPELNALSKTGDVAAMIGLVDDEMVHTLAVAGTPEECAAELHRRFGDVAERVCCLLPGLRRAARPGRRPREGPAATPGRPHTVGSRTKEATWVSAASSA